MLEWSLYRLAARRRLLAGCAHLLTVPWEFHARAGVLRINGEPVALPRRWQREDNGFAWAGPALRAAWSALAVDPLRMCGQIDGTPQPGFWGWRLSVHALQMEDGDEGFDLVFDADALRARADEGGACDAGGEGLTAMLEAAWGEPYESMYVSWHRGRELPSLDDELAEMVNVVVHTSLVAWMQGDDADDPALREVSSEMAALALNELHAWHGEGNWRDALLVLAAGDDDVFADTLHALAPASGLREDVANWLNVMAHAQTWPAGDHVLLPWLPLWLGDAAHSATPSAAALREWLRSQGLSRSAFVRLARLPLDAHAAFVEVAAHHCGALRRHTMIAFARLLAALHARQQKTISRAALCDAARMAALTGAMLDGRDEAVQWRWRLPDDGRDDVFMMLAVDVSPLNAAAEALYLLLRAEYGAFDAAHEPHRGQGNAAKTLAQALAVTPATVRAFSDTVIHALLGDGNVDPVEILEALPAIRDWVRACQESRPPLRVRLLPEQLGPRWHTLLRGQARWHAAFHARRGDLAPEDQRAIDLGQRIDRRGLPGAMQHPFLPPPTTAWSAGCDAFSCGDIDVVPLTSNVALAVEGQRLQHCVSSYVETCLLRGHRIFSLRYAPDDSSIGTAECVRRSSGWVLLQFRGIRNQQFTTVNGVVEPYADVIVELLLRLNGASGMVETRAA